MCTYSVNDEGFLEGRQEWLGLKVGTLIPMGLNLK